MHTNGSQPNDGASILVEICINPNCARNGGGTLVRHLSEELGVASRSIVEGPCLGQSLGKSNDVEVYTTTCLGDCEKQPAASVASVERDGNGWYRYRASVPCPYASVCNIKDAIDALVTKE